MNYDSVNEIFSAGVTNMTCLLQDSGSYDGGTLAVSGADFFTFMGNAVPSVYAHGDSYWGFGSDTSHLKVDNRDTRMRSLYREEGTLYSYYRFLKIRWEGWSHYNASGADYQLKYDLILWDTGDISLHMIEVPVKRINTGGVSGVPKAYINGRIYYDNYNQQLLVANIVTNEIMPPESQSFFNSSHEMNLTPVRNEPLLYFGDYGTWSTAGWYMLCNYLATINNLDTPVTKTADKTMKITYILQEQ